MNRFDYYVILRDTKTGQTKAIEAVWDGDLHEGTEFMWSEGNYSCDCNRDDFMYGRDEILDKSCGDSRFRIIATNVPDLRIELDDG